MLQEELPGFFQRSFRALFWCGVALAHFGDGLSSLTRNFTSDPLNVSRLSKKNIHRAVLFLRRFAREKNLQIHQNCLKYSAVVNKDGKTLFLHIFPLREEKYSPYKSLNCCQKRTRRHIFLASCTLAVLSYCKSVLHFKKFNFHKFSQSNSTASMCTARCSNSASFIPSARALLCSVPL